MRRGFPDTRPDSSGSEPSRSPQSRRPVVDVRPRRVRRGLFGVYWSRDIVFGLVGFVIMLTGLVIAASVLLSREGMC